MNLKMENCKWKKKLKLDLSQLNTLKDVLNLNIKYNFSLLFLSHLSILRFIILVSSFKNVLRFSPHMYLEFIFEDNIYMTTKLITEKKVLYENPP